MLSGQSATQARRQSRRDRAGQRPFAV